ncbi:MAG: hypothetical protein ABI140_01600 [Jatrophihabitantaceae bacterium]
MAVTMWEAKAASGQLDALAGWVSARAATGSQLYRNDEQARLVVIDPTGQARELLAGLPAELIERPAQAWDFEPVRNV